MKGGCEGPPRKARRGKGQARACPAQSVAASPLNSANQDTEDKPLFTMHSATWGEMRARARPQLGGPAPAPPPDLPGSAGVPPAFCPGQRFRPCQRLRTRVQTGNILYTINRKHGLHFAKISGKELGSPLKITPPWRRSRRDRGGARGRAGGGGPPGSEAR